MAEPIVFAKCDGTPGSEALRLVYRSDRSTTEGEQQVTIRARSLDQEAISKIQLFIDTARPILAEMGEQEINFLHIEGPDGSAHVW